jgi:hypothetical protein
MSMLLPLVLAYLILAASIAINLLLFVTLKREIAAQSHRFREHLDDCREAIYTLKNAPPGPDPSPSSIPVGGESPQSRRARILLRAIQGERPDEISASLAIPLNEVSLVLLTAQATSSAA